MKNKSNAFSGEAMQLAFHAIRNVSSPEDLQNERKVFITQSPINSIVNFPTNENVRGYLVEATGKTKRVYSSVHKAIRDTLINDPHNFSLLNSGITIVARDIQIDEANKVVLLKNASIVNGSQTQGVIKDLIDNESYDFTNIHVKCEIIVVDDDDLIAEISIARNFQNDVMLVSIAGRRGHFNEIEESLQKEHPHLRLRKSETEWSSDEVIDSEKLIQVITGLIPDELWMRKEEKDNPNKVYTYSMKARCLKEFQTLYEAAHDKSNPNHVFYKDLYQFYLDITPYAFDLYKRWKTHQGFAGSRLWAIKRDGRTIVDVPDGIVFPIICALSVFCTKKRGKWVLDVPSDLIDGELIKVAKTSYQEIASSNPQTMGKTKACYSSILQITRIYKKLI